MHLIVAKAHLSPNVTRLDVVAPRIAQIRQPGQFVIVHRGEGAERIPLTIADADAAAGTIALVIQSVGKSTRELVALEPGEAIADIAGPLGHPTELIASGRALCIGGGVGTAVVHPIAQGLQRRGVAVLSIIGGRSKEWVIFEAELRRLGEVKVCTDDGSYGRHGFVTDAAKDALAAGGIDIVYAVGPVPMMRAVVNLTKPLGRPHDRLAQPGDGGRHGHVRRLPRGRGRPDAVRLRGWPGVRRPPGGFRPADGPLEHLPRLRAARPSPPARRAPARLG